MMHVLLSVLWLVAPSAVADAPPQVYVLESSLAQFEIGYTFGTHTGKATGLSGQVIWKKDAVHGDGFRGEFLVPIERIDTGDPKQNCHLREALGLDYGVSRFPEEHVCDEGHQLPTTGGDAIVFPLIKFSLTDVRARDSTAVVLSSTQPATVDVEGQWSIHGARKAGKLTFNLLASDVNTVRAIGTAEVRLADFGVEVKPAKILFMKIAVAETAKVKLELLFRVAGLKR